MDLKIIVDHRENKGQLPRYLYEKDIQLETKALEVGDFILSNECVVELKKVSDFVNSLVDGRLFTQAKELRENFQKPLYIIEGDMRDIFEIQNVHAKQSIEHYQQNILSIAYLLIFHLQVLQRFFKLLPQAPGLCSVLSQLDHQLDQAITA